MKEGNRQWMIIMSNFSNGNAKTEANEPWQGLMGGLTLVDRVVKLKPLKRSR